MNGDIKLKKKCVQAVEWNARHSEQMDKKMKTEYKETFAEIHAPETLNGKVRNMTSIKKTKEGTFVKRFVTVAAALAVVFLGSNGVVYAATGSTWIGGIFKDITDWSGAVVGQEYVQATDEVGMRVLEAVVSNEYVSLPVEMEFYKKEEAVFRSIEEVKLESYKVLDEAGNVVISSGEANATGVVKDGVVEITLLFDGGQLFQDVEYTLAIEAFDGLSKADAPIEIKGNWECKFVIGGNK